MSPQSQNELIPLVADEIRKSVFQEIQASGFYSVMADSTPDISHKDILSVVIRSVGENCKTRWDRGSKCVENAEEKGA